MIRRTAARNNSGDPRGPSASEGTSPRGGRLWFALWRAIAAGAGGAFAVRHEWARRRGARADARDHAERLGLAGPPISSPGSLWFHAASMGEVGALAALVRAVDALVPNLPRIVTTSTTTGRERAARDLSPASALAPLDGVKPLRRFLERYEPGLYVGVETEIWPLRFEALAARGVPAALVSARVSPERLPRYLRARPLYARALASLTLLAPASAADRERFLALGMPLSRLGPEGNLKWDGAPPPPGEADVRELRAELGLAPSWPWIVLGSVHPGETAAVLPALLPLLAERRAGLIVAPRHPERFDDIARELAAAGQDSWRLSRGPAPAGAAVLLLDRLGVLARVYACARTALMGGTIAPIGGHSPLEAAAAGCALVAGPHIEHQRDLVEPLAEHGALVRAADGHEAGSRLAQLATDGARAAAIGAAASRLVTERRGHAERLARAVLELRG